MAQQITIIKQTFAKLEPRVDYGDLLFELKADSEWGLFATFSVSEHKTTKCLDSAPKSFTDNFRVINFLNPHLAKILSLYFEVFRFENASGLANGVIRFFQILSNGIENQVFFDNDISIEDIKSANILNLKPNFALVKKILRYIQKKITNHTHVHYSKTHRNLLWDAILYSLTGILHSQALPRIEMLFNNIFPSTIELE